MNGKCERCNGETIMTKMSFFNTEMICGNCQTKEKAHPQYAEAREKELEEIKSGNYNFVGIGKPNDL